MISHRPHIRSLVITAAVAFFTTPCFADGPDCNSNGIPDADDIANCVGDPACDDCNLDGVPDGCDMPTNCVEWIATTPGVWSDGTNWSGGVAPINNGMTYSVTISGFESYVIVDVDVTIDTLRLRSLAGLAIHDGDLSVVAGGGATVNNSTLDIAFDRRMTVANGPFDLTRGWVEASGILELGGDFLVTELEQFSFMFFNHIIISGSGDPQEFEVYDFDLGSILTSIDYAFTPIVEMTTQPGSSIIFVDNRLTAKHTQHDCGEALYVQQLTVGAGANVAVEDCKLYYQELKTNSIPIEEIGCGNVQDFQYGTFCQRDCDCFTSAVDNANQQNDIPSNFLDVCKYNYCLTQEGFSGGCSTCTRRWGNACLPYGDLVQTSDILCAVLGFGNYCGCPNSDIYASNWTKGPSGVPIGTDDILGIVGAFGGANPFACPVGNSCDSESPPASVGCTSATTTALSEFDATDRDTTLSRQLNFASSNATFTMAPRRPSVQAGKTIHVDVFVNNVEGLIGFEFGLAANGGQTGNLSLENVNVETHRKDYVFSGLTNFPATDRELGRIGGALLGGGVDVTADKAYIGTFSFVASHDARGTFNLSATTDYVALFSELNVSILNPINDITILVTAPQPLR